MDYWQLDQILEICKMALENLEHWDGKNLTKEELENLIGGVEWDLRLMKDLLNDFKKEL